MELFPANINSPTHVHVHLGHNYTQNVSCGNLNFKTSPANVFDYTVWLEVLVTIAHVHCRQSCDHSFGTTESN